MGKTMNKLERNREKWARGEDSAPPSGNWLHMARHTGKQDVMRVPSDPAKFDPTLITRHMLDTASTMREQRCSQPRSAQKADAQGTYGNIYRIKPEACEFTLDGDDATFYKGQIVGAIKQRPERKYLYLAFHIIAEDGRRLTVHGKRVFGAEAPFLLNENRFVQKN